VSMKTFIGDQEIIAGDEALELALDLWLGPEEETEEEQAARLDAGRDILADDPELFDLAVRVVVQPLARRRSNVRQATVLPVRRVDSVGEVAA
jgi:hypothetical protein